MNSGLDAVRYSFIVMDLHHLSLPVSRRTPLHPPWRSNGQHRRRIHAADTGSGGRVVATTLIVSVEGLRPSLGRAPVRYSPRTELEDRVIALP